MANFRRGKEAAEQAATRTGGGKFTPTHQFTPDEDTYLQFLMSWEEIPTVLMHRFICVGYREDGSKIYRDFISPLDEAIDGATGSDPLVDRFGSNPKERCIGLALELEPLFEKKGSRKVIVGWDAKTRKYTTQEGEEKEVPNVALVIESPFTFFGHLGVVDDTAPIQENILKITRKGKKTDTTYTILPVGDALSDEELEQMGVDEFFEEFDFDNYLEELADKDRLHDAIDPLDDDFVVNPYAKKGKGGDKKNESGSSRRRRVVEEEADEDENGATVADESEGEAPPRKRRFNQLRTEVKGE